MNVSFDVHRQDVDGHLVVSTFRHDEVGISLAGFDELLVHGLQHACVAFHDGFGGSSAFHHVALDDTDESFVGGGIDKDFQIHHVAQLLVAKGEDAFDDDDVARLDVDGFRQARAGQVRVGGLFDAFALAQHSHVFGQKAPLESVGMVEIDVLSFFYRHVATVFVIRILWQQDNFACRQAFDNFLYDGGLSRARSAGYSDY